MGKFLLGLAKFLLGNYFSKGIIIGNHIQDRYQVTLEVETLGQYFEFIHHDALTGRMAMAGKRPFCLFTFDDGKKINVLEAVHVLERLGVPAVFYLVTDSVTSNLPLWFDRRNTIVKYLGMIPEELKPERLKKMPLAQIHAQLDQFAEKYSVCPDTNDPCVGAMSWDEARMLQKKGFTIGAHTRNHPILTNESLEEAKGEIGGSIASVTREMGHDCVSFAFPNGSYTNDLARFAASCGVKTVMTTDPIWVGASAETWHLPRIDIYNHYDPQKILIKVAAALPGCLLKNPNGTGRAYVKVRWFHGDR